MVEQVEDNCKLFNIVMKKMLYSVACFLYVVSNKSLIWHSLGFG